MAESIESFVAKLQADGVEAGRAEAETIKADATAEAERIVAEANQQAETTVSRAQADAEGALARGRTELELAARDTVLKLNETLGGILQRILAEAAAKPMGQPEFLSKVLHDVILRYVDTLQQRGESMTINVPADLQDELADWALSELGKATLEGIRGSVDLRGALAGAGFEYTVSGGTVEVTPESVTHTLAEILTPRMRDVLESAAQGRNES